MSFIVHNIISNMLLEIFPLQGKLRNHRHYVFGCSAVDKRLVGSMLHFVRNLITICFYVYC